jgi:uncharacterized membrane protein YdbT with pleckstrin-like domain
MAEKNIWSEKASMKDFYVTPTHWLFTFITLGLYFLIIYLTRLNTRYSLTNERLMIESGFFRKHIDEIELFRIKDTTLSQSLFQRFVGLGNISVASTDNTGDLIMKCLPNAKEKREQLRTLSNEARSKKGVRTLVHE